MKRLYLLPLFIFSFAITGLSQNDGRSFDLLELMKQAKEIHPTHANLAKVDSLVLLQRRLTHSNWFPALAFNAQASWQSEVPGINIPSGLPIDLQVGAPKDQYEIALDVRQLIYDGGRMKSEIQLQSAEGQLQSEVLNKGLYELSQKLSEWCFYRLSLSKQDSVLLSRKRALQARYQSAQSAVEGGLATSSKAKRIAAELLILEQERLQIHTAIEQSLIALNLLLPEKITAADQIIVPSFSGNYQKDFDLRPEVQVFEKQSGVLEFQKKKTTRQNWPTLSAFAHAGYGNPGLVFLQDEWNSYIKTGAALSWSIFDGFQSKKKKALFQVQQNMIEQQKSSFILQENIRLDGLREKITQLEELLLKDMEILTLLDDIVQDANAQLDAGVITVTSYLSDLERWTALQSQKELHHIQLQQAQFNYMFYQGKW